MEKPKIRFKGYQEDWEQRKLGDWGDFYYGRSCPKWSVTEDATIPCIRYGELYTKFGAKIDRVYSHTNMPPENLRFSKGTEVLIPRVGEDPMDYNHCTWLSMQGVAIGEMISVFNTDNNPLFTATMFNATLQNEFAMRVEGGSVTNLYFEKLKNIDVSFPSIPEQEKIAAYYESLDHLITLHQRKCEETKILKKYMLQKMFPQNGNSVPEIRFSGFTEDWEQRKLGDVLERRIEQRQQSEEYPRLAFASGQGVIPLSERKTNNREQLTKDEYTKKYLVTELNDIVYNPANVKYGAIDRNKCGRGLISPIYVTFTTNEIPGFIERIVTSHDFQQRALRFEEGTVTKRQSVNPEDLVTLDILVAPKREEQQKIATYFDNIDHLITLHQRKCEELQNIKKYMLQNMFV